LLKKNEIRSEPTRQPLSPLLSCARAPHGTDRPSCCHAAIASPCLSCRCYRWPVPHATQPFSHPLPIAPSLSRAPRHRAAPRHLNLCRARAPCRIPMPRHGVGPRQPHLRADLLFLCRPSVPDAATSRRHRFSGKFPLESPPPHLPVLSSRWPSLLRSPPPESSTAGRRHFPRGRADMSAVLRLPTRRSKLCPPRAVPSSALHSSFAPSVEAPHPLPLPCSCHDPWPPVSNTRT
jgi:hypothetical protein